MECHIDMRYWPLIGTTTTTFTLDTYPSHYIEPWANTAPCNRRHLFCPDRGAGNIYQLMSIWISSTKEMIFSNAFYWQKMFVFLSKFQQCFYSLWHSNNDSVMIDVMAWRQTGNKIKYLKQWWHKWLTNRCVTSQQTQQYGHHFADDNLNYVFLNTNCCIFYSNFIEVCSQRSNKHTVAFGLGRVLTWCSTDDKPSTKLIMIQI